MSFNFFFKPTICSCINNKPSDSSTSFSRRWYNPLRHRQYDYQPEIVRRWIDADPPVPSQEKFSVLSYNILGERNASRHRDLYSNVPSLYMKWDNRKRVICKELVGWNPDIICLQEVDRYYDLSNILEKAGYAGSYKRRTGDSVDGCAMFWKADKFQLLEVENIEFKGLGLRDNVAHLSVFETRKAEPRRLLIGNIHVLYNPNLGDVKLGQIRFLLTRTQILSERWGNIPVVLAGDFNSTPQSPIYEFLSSSQLNIMLYDRRELSGQRFCHPSYVFGKEGAKKSPTFPLDRFLKYCWTDDEIKVATGNAKSQIVVNPLKLNSSYATVKGSLGTRGSNAEPLATSYHSKFFGTVDYLWYSDGITPARVLDTVPVDVLRKTGGLPSKKLGSDHLCLISEFAFTKASEENNRASATTLSAVGTSNSDGAC